MLYLIERFEEDFAVMECLENDDYINIKKDILKPYLEVGNVFNYENNIWTFNENETKTRKERINKKFNSLWN